MPVNFFNCSGWNYFNFYTYFWISLKNLTDYDVWPPFWPWLFLHKMQKKRRLKWRPNIMIGQIFQWNPKIYIKIEIISPRAIKKVDGHPPKSWPQCWQFWTLDYCNVGCWADGTNPIIDFESLALGLSYPMKKNFFFDIWKLKCHSSKFCMLIIETILLYISLLFKTFPNNNLINTDYYLNINILELIM